MTSAWFNWASNGYETRIRHLEGIVSQLATPRRHPPSAIKCSAPLAGSFRYSMDRGLIPLLSKATEKSLESAQSFSTRLDSWSPTTSGARRRPSPPPIPSHSTQRSTSTLGRPPTPSAMLCSSRHIANPSLPSNLVNLTSRKPLKGTYSSVLTQVDSRPLATSRPRPRSFPLPTHGPVLLGAKQTLAGSEIRTNHVAISEPNSSVRHPASSPSALAPPSCPLSPSAPTTEGDLSPEKNTPCSSVAPGDPVPISSTDETATSILATSVSQPGINVDQARPPSPPPSASAPHPLLALSSPSDPLIDCPTQTQGRSLPQSRSSDRFPPPQRPRNQPSKGFSVACRDPLLFTHPNISSTQDTSVPASDPRTDVDDGPNEWTSQTRKLPSTPMFLIDPSENDIPNLYLELGYGYSCFRDFIINNLPNHSCLPCRLCCCRYRIHSGRSRLL
ncbi:hypothetical protein PSTT_03458 [Puccinia striiformis]|uniref:Uncharacterized protein n=1 Tax=Puccinia striiformis TaxID=27350 RepID=A0A2S4VWL0_9BASI|nr:hypothetical protein PSTT_03458 [Puccinia striiformis]